MDAETARKRCTLLSATTVSGQVSGGLGIRREWTAKIGHIHMLSLKNKTT